MSAYDYTKPRSTAERLIQRFGQTMTLVQRVWTGEGYGAEYSDTQSAVTGTVTEYGDKLINGTQIKAGDKQVLLSTAGVANAPTTSDKLIIGGVTHSIVNVKPLSPAGTVVFWEAQARS